MNSDVYSEQAPSELGAMLEIYRDPALLVRRDYRIMAFNTAYRNVYGPVDLSDPPCCYTVSHGHTKPCDEAGETCPLRSAMASGQSRQAVHMHRTRQGIDRVELEVFPLLQDHQRPRYFVEHLRPGAMANGRADLDTLVGESTVFNNMMQLIRRVALSDSTVLLLGETGTGKELIAKALHRASRRHHAPFVPVDCSSLTESLFESELFGHEKAAFTGAAGQKRGLVEVANHGTLFIDEIGDISLALQVKLLRLIETASFRRVGGVELQHVDLRFVCATHRDLWTMVQEGTFRQDLYYRLSVFPVTVPPLRERRSDIPGLAEALLQRLSRGRAPHLHPKTLRCLMHYDFPGNVRELRHILERALLLTEGDTIEPEILRTLCRCTADGQARAGWMTPEWFPLKEAEQRYLQYVSSNFRGDRRSLAKVLGVSERTLYRRLAELDGKGHPRSS